MAGHLITHFDELKESKQKLYNVKMVLLLKKYYDSLNSLERLVFFESSIEYLKKECSFFNSVKHSYGELQYEYDPIKLLEFIIELQLQNNEPHVVGDFSAIYNDLWYNFCHNMIPIHKKNQRSPTNVFIEFIQQWISLPHSHEHPV